MKKNVIVFLLILFLPIIVSAGGESDDGVANATMIRATCVYRNTTSFNERGSNHTRYNYNEFDFSGISYTVGGPHAAIKSYYNEDLGTNITTFEEEWYGTDYIINFNKDFGVKFSIDAFMMTQFDKYDNDEETLQDAIDTGKFCPSTVFEVVKENEKEYMFCNGYNSDLGVETCDLVDEYLEENYSEYRIKKQTLYVNSAISNNGQEDMTNTDVREEFVKIEEEKEAVCDSNSASYDPEKCKALGELNNTVIEQAEDQGISKQELYEYKEMQFSPITPPDLTNKCTGGEDSLLGNPTCTSGEDCDPAFYIQVIFTVLKYIAIVILIVMSIYDFVGAVTSSDDNAIKKATTKCITRAILCVLIFFMPTILEYIFTWMKVYTPSICGIK